jgi:SWIM zinc finger
VPKRVRKIAADRAAPYIDSPLMTQRVRHGRQISARIDGNYGVYRTRKRIGARGAGTCSCPSEGWPCKHLRALEATWRANPESFFDLQPVLESLAGQSKADLIRAVGEMALRAPETLSVFGVTNLIEHDDEAG